MKKLLPILLTTLILYAIVIYLSSSITNYDTQSYNVIGVLTLNGISIYPDPAISRHPYLPFFLFLETGALLLARLTHISQIIILKSIFTLFHLFSVFVVFHLAKKNVKTALLYAVNPISLFIIAFHGQFDIIPLALILYSILLLPQKKYALIMVLFGIAFTAKTWPILFIVPFLKRIPKKFWVLFFVPPVIFLLLYTALFPSTSLTSIAHVLAVYQGVGGIWGFGKFLSFIEADKITLFIYKIGFIVGLFLYSTIQKNQALLEEIVELLLIFFLFTPGFGIQWFLWLTPFFFLSKKSLFSLLYMPVCVALFIAYLSWIPSLHILESATNLILLATSGLFFLYTVLMGSVPRQ